MFPRNMTWVALKMLVFFLLCVAAVHTQNKGLVSSHAYA